MAQNKPVAYPNIVDQLKSVVSAHAAIHDDVTTHAQKHLAKLEDKRKQLHVQQMSKKLIESDGK